MNQAAKANAAALDMEIAWFTEVLETRLALYFGQDCRHVSIYDIAPPDLNGDDSGYAQTVRELGMGFDERIVFVLALLPHLRPQALDTLFVRNKNLERGFTEFGGWKGTMHGGFLPTVETAAFILAGTNLEKRFEVIRLFEDGQFLVDEQVVCIDNRGPGEPFFSGALNIGNAYLNRCSTGICHKPDFAVNFPAKRITSKLSWNDLVLSPEALEGVEDIASWIRHSRTLLNDWGLEKSLKAGYRSLFYGPPGTGKTLTATLIGDSLGLDVYRIDLSMVVSKYIGETEKNLAGVFDQAMRKNWILFFDEADALFGKRTQAATSNDRYANQEISYLLQRVEDFPGVVILASNLKANIDEAFARRFQSVIFFPMPDADQRLRLWQGILGDACRLAGDIDLEDIAEKYELSGGAITNVVRYAAIRAVQRADARLGLADVLKGIAKELSKEGKTL